MTNEWFYVLPEIDVKKLENLFRQEVFKMLLILGEVVDWLALTR